MVGQFFVLPLFAHSDLQPLDNSSYAAADCRNGVCSWPGQT